MNADGKDVKRQRDDLLGRVGRVDPVDRILNSAPDVVGRVYLEV